jgi:hypothetical protein
MNTSAFCQAASSGPRLPLSVLADPVIGHNDHGSVSRIWNSPDRFLELRSRSGPLLEALHELFVKRRSPDRNRHCRFSPIR